MYYSLMFFESYICPCVTEYVLQLLDIYGNNCPYSTMYYDVNCVPQKICALIVRY